MFGKLMNRYYYGKSGKGDYTPEDLPQNRWQLFWEMLRVRFSGLIRLNLIYMLIWLPTIIVLALSLLTAVNMLNLAYGTDEETEVVETVSTEEAAATATEAAALETATEAAAVEAAAETVAASETATEAATTITPENLLEALQSLLFSTLLFLFPCIAITGPFTAGVTYVTRNWARDEHAFVWSDFKDALKANWKYGLLTSAITGILPPVVYYYIFLCSQLAANSFFFYIPMMMMIILLLVWSMMLIFLYPQMVTYDLKYKGLLKNSVIMAIGRLPMAFGLRLLSFVPTLIAVVLFFLTSSLLCPLILGLYYILLGYALSRFVGVSYVNGVLDKYINSHIEGAEVNRGLAPEEEEDDLPLDEN